MRDVNLPALRAARRLSEATGYLELRMTRHALACLDGIKDAGPWDAVAELLRAEAARCERRFGDAAESLAAAAQLMPPRVGKSLWLAVSMCHRRAGNVDRAIESLAHARGALPPRARRKAE